MPTGHASMALYLLIVVLDLPVHEVRLTYLCIDVGPCREPSYSSVRAAHAADPMGGIVLLVVDAHCEDMVCWEDCPGRAGTDQDVLKSCRAPPIAEAGGDER